MENAHDPNALQEIRDSLDSIHQRVDRFYAWAAELQLQMRNIQGRQTFLESQIQIDVINTEEINLQTRLEKIKRS